MFVLDGFLGQVVTLPWLISFGALRYKHVCLGSLLFKVGLYPYWRGSHRCQHTTQVVAVVGSTPDLLAPIATQYTRQDGRVSRSVPLPPNHTSGGSSGIHARFNCTDRYEMLDKMAESPGVHPDTHGHTARHKIHIKLGGKIN